MEEMYGQDIIREDGSALSVEKEPKYIIVKNFYLDYIKNNELKAGELLPSELEVSRIFKFSRDTIRRALNELENEGYIRRERGRGTFYVGSHTLREKKVAVLTTYVSSYIFPSIISGIEEEVSSRQYTLTFASTRNDPEIEREHLRNIIDTGVEGLIIEPARSAERSINIDLYKELDAKGIPFVMINAMYKELEPSYVIMDDFKGGYMATKYLLQLGHRKIAGIFKKDDLQGVYRRNGYLKALREYNVSIDNKIIGEYCTGASDSFSYYFTDNLLNQKDRVSAIFCYNEEIAMNVIDAIYDNGLKIPEDISLVAYDDSPLATMGGLRLTTIRHPQKELGKKAALQLFNMIENVASKPQFMYEPELIVRSSCREI